MNMGIDVRDTLPTIRVPVLVLHFDNDPWAPVEAGRLFAAGIPAAEYVELEGNCHIPSMLEVDLFIDEVERFLVATWESEDWPEIEDDRVLATILFTDIVGSTAQLAELGDARWRALLEAHHTAVRRRLVRHRGVEVDTAGDGFFASFDGPARAIRCACDITRAVDDLGMHVRAGLHTGECQVVDGKIGGIAVHIGARVAAQAGAGEVLVSGTVRDLVAGSGITFADRGVHPLKGLGDWPLYAVTAV
jgi:class 3 adenylate cyclase